MLAGLGYPIVGPPRPEPSIHDDDAGKRGGEREEEREKGRQNGEIETRPFPITGPIVCCPDFWNMIVIIIRWRTLCLPSIADRIDPPRIFLVPRQVRLPSLPILLYLSCLLAFFGEIRFFPLLIL